MHKRISIRSFIHALEALPSNRPKVTPGKPYRTQKEHWLRWLADYHRPGFYNRIPGMRRDARFAYNHIVEPKMLLWLIHAAGIPATLASQARRATKDALSLNQQSAAIRRHVPWDMVAGALTSRMMKNGMRLWIPSLIRRPAPAS